MRSRALMVLALCGVLLAQQAASPPLSKADVLKLLRGGVAPKRVTAIVEERGVDFEANEGTIADLRRAGADQSVIEAVQRGGTGKRLAAAEQLRKQRKYAEALRAYQDIRAAAPNNPAVYVGLGDVYAWQSDWKQAEENYRQALKLQPDSAEARRGTARSLYYLKNDLAAAIAEVRMAIRLKPEWAPAHSTLSAFLTLQKDLVGAEAEAREALRLDPGSDQARVALGYALMAKDPDGALAEFRAARALNGEYAMGALFGTMGVLENRKDYYGYMSVAREAVRLDPTSAAAHNALGWSMGRVGDWDGAIAAYREAIRLDPRLDRAHFNLASALYQKGDKQGAIGQMRELLRQEPENAAAHNGLGWYLNSAGDTAGAEAEYRYALRARPNFADAHANLAEVLKKKGDKQGAIAELREAIRLEPSDADHHYQLASLALEQRDMAGAGAGFREALRLAPNSATTHYGLAHYLAETKDSDGAIREYREAVRLDPNHASAYNNLGVELSNARKDHAGAAEAYRAAIRIDPKDAQYHHNLGIVLDKLDRNREALQEYSKAAELEPSNSTYRRSYERMSKYCTDFPAKC